MSEDASCLVILNFIAILDYQFELLYYKLSRQTEISLKCVHYFS